VVRRLFGAIVGVLPEIWKSMPFYYDIRLLYSLTSCRRGVMRYRSKIRLSRGGPEQVDDQLVIQNPSLASYKAQK
jgi:hypothetical protein